MCRGDAQWHVEFQIHTCWETPSPASTGQIQEHSMGVGRGIRSAGDRLRTNPYQPAGTLLGRANTATPTAPVLAAERRGGSMLLFPSSVGAGTPGRGG